MVLSTDEGKMEREIDIQVGAASVPVCCGEEKAESKGKDPDLSVDLRSYANL